MKQPMLHSHSLTPKKAVKSEYYQKSKIKNWPFPVSRSHFRRHDLLQQVPHCTAYISAYHMWRPKSTPSASNLRKTASRGTNFAKSHQPEVPFPPRGVKVSQSNLIQYTPSTVLYNNVVHARGATTNPTRARDRLRSQNSNFSGTGRDF